MSNYYHFQLGRFQCLSLADMQGERNLWDTFPDVPREKLEAALAEGHHTAEWVRHGNVLMVDTREKKSAVRCGSAQRSVGGEPAGGGRKSRRH